MTVYDFAIGVCAFRVAVAIAVLIDVLPGYWPELSVWHQRQREHAYLRECYVSRQWLVPAGHANRFTARHTLPSARLDAAELGGNYESAPRPDDRFARFTGGLDELQRLDDGGAPR